jgi:RNAse (barnase) inhibitor barstar
MRPNPPPSAVTALAHGSECRAAGVRELPALIDRRSSNVARFEIDAGAIQDMPSFHDVFERNLRFFDGYGRNMDAWIDCMTDLHGPHALSSLNLPEGERIELVLSGTQDLSRRKPEIIRELIECTAAAYSAAAKRSAGAAPCH